MITIEEIKELISSNGELYWKRAMEIRNKIKNEISFKMILDSEHPLLLGIAAYQTAFYDIDSVGSGFYVPDIIDKHNNINRIDELAYNKEADVCRLMEYAFFAFARLNEYSDSEESNKIDTWASAAIRMQMMIYHFPEFLISFVKGYMLRAAEEKYFPYSVAENALDYIKAYLIHFNYSVYKNRGQSISIYLSKGEEEKLIEAEKDAQLAGPFYRRDDVIKIGREMVNLIPIIIKCDVGEELYYGPSAVKDGMYYNTKKLALKGNILMQYFNAVR